MKPKPKEKPARKKTSQLWGVSWHPSRKRWLSQIRSAGFHRFCRSEAEAAAHYNAVASVMEKPPRDTSGQPRWNNLWDIRPNDGYYTDPDGYEWRRIDIDNENYTVVDNAQIYLAYKDDDWFIDRDGEVTMIAGVDGPPWQFAYVRLADLLIGAKAVHLNGDPLDNRRCNLVEADKAPAPRSTLDRRPSKPLVNFKPSTRKLTH